MRSAMRYTMLGALWIGIAVGAASALSCTRVVDLDLPDASSGLPDAAVGDGAIVGDGFVDQDAITTGDGGAGDAFPAPDAL